MELEVALQRLKISERTFHRRLSARMGGRERIVDGHITPEAAQVLGLTADEPPKPKKPAPVLQKLPVRTSKPPVVQADGRVAIAPEIHQQIRATIVRAGDVEGLQAIIDAQSEQMKRQQAEIARLSEYVEQCDELLGAMAHTIADQDLRLARVEQSHKVRQSPLAGLKRLFHRARPVQVVSNRIGPPPITFFANTLTRF